jgi:hypothetical protein
MPVIPVLKRLRQEDCEFEAILGYLARPCFKKPPKPKIEYEQHAQVVNFQWELSEQEALMMPLSPWCVPLRDLAGVKMLTGGAQPLTVGACQRNLP